MVMNFQTSNVTRNIVKEVTTRLAYARNFRNIRFLLINHILAEKLMQSENINIEFALYRIKTLHSNNV